jgi:hypothetical protein
LRTLDLLVRLGRGDIVPKPGIKRLVGGSAVEAVAIIYYTGYKVSFPFFDPGFPAAPGRPAAMAAARLGEDDLFLMGLLQPRGAIMPFAGKGEADRRAAGRALRPALGRDNASRHGTGARAGERRFKTVAAECRKLPAPGPDQRPAPRELLQGSRQPESLPEYEEQKAGRSKVTRLR